MNKKASLILLIALLFTAGAAWIYLCKIKEVCSGVPEATEEMSQDSTSSL